VQRVEEAVSEPEVPLGSDLLAPDWVPPELNTGIATPARIYDYWLGGKDNFPVDRAAAEAALRSVPEVLALVRANRAFLGRAVRTLAAEGITQFLDIGIGLPGPAGTVETAQSVLPDAVVVGVDNDPIVLAHARARPEETGPGRVTIVQADVRDPKSILSHPEVRAAIDFDRPVAILLVAILHFVDDDHDPRGIITTLMDAVAPGSYLVISHATGDFEPERVAASTHAYDNATAMLVPRALGEVTAFFDGLELLDPGVVQQPWWRPDDPAGAVPPESEKVFMYAGLARKA
jgi:SAM-dependent methyltransferase